VGTGSSVEDGIGSSVDDGIGSSVDDGAEASVVSLGNDPPSGSPVGESTESKDLVEVPESVSSVVVGLGTGSSLEGTGSSVGVRTESKDRVEVGESPSLVVSCASPDVGADSPAPSEVEVSSSAPSDVVEGGSTKTVVVTTGISVPMGSSKAVLVIKGTSVVVSTGCCVDVSRPVESPVGGGFPSMKSKLRVAARASADDEASARAAISRRARLSGLLVPAC
jgi:hypothetical protein